MAGYRMGSVERVTLGVVNFDNIHSMHIMPG